MNSITVFLLFSLAVFIFSNPIVHNEEELENFLKTSKLSRESQQTLREYQREGMLAFPFDPFALLSQFQNIFAQLPNFFTSFLRIPNFFTPADTRISTDRYVKPNKKTSVERIENDE